MAEMNKIVIDDTVYETKLTKQYVNRKPYQKADPKKVLAFIPGTIRDIFVSEGQSVKWGDPMLILEAMKMKNTVNADFDGKIKSIVVKSDQNVLKNALLIEFE